MLLLAYAAISLNLESGYDLLGTEQARRLGAIKHDEVAEYKINVLIKRNRLDSLQAVERRRALPRLALNVHNLEVLQGLIFVKPVA